MKIEREQVLFLQPPIFSGGDAAPEVLVFVGSGTIFVPNINFVRLANTGAQNVTSLSGGMNGRPVAFLGDGFTTFAHNATIKTNTGANKLLVADRVYKFWHYAGVWYEEE